MVFKSLSLGVATSVNIRQYSFVEAVYFYEGK